MCLKKIEQACSISKYPIYVPKKIRTGVFYFQDLVYASQKIEQACSILNFFQKCSYRHSIDKKYHL